MKLTCPRCSATITSKQIDIKDTKAHCNECNFLFDFIGEIYSQRISKDKARTIKLSPSETKFFQKPNDALLTCTECQANIPQKNINHHAMVVNCPACDHVLDFSAKRLAFNSSKESIQDQISEIRELEFVEDETEIFFKFRDPTELNMGVIPGGIFVGVLILLRPALLLLICCIIVELIFVYLFLGSIFNSKIMHVNKHHITIKSVPFNLGNNLKIARKDVLQLFARIYQNGTTKTGNPIYRHAFSFINERGRQVDLIKNFLKPDIPLFIENKVEAFWGTKNFPVSGEIE